MPAAKRQVIPRKAYSWGYLIVWEFRIRPRMRKRFLEAYGPNGVWENLFARDEHYLGTDLIQDLKVPQTYWTLDFWTSRRAYDNFKNGHAKEYNQIDAMCEHLTLSEREVGTFSHPR
jgi:hypothetical protein